MLDIKNLGQVDIDSFQNRLRQHQELMIYIALAIATLWMTAKIIGEQNIKLATIQTELSSLSDKEKAISEYENIKSTFEKYVSSLPQGTVDLESISNLINEFARTRDIQILSFTPGGDPRPTDFYDAAYLEVNISASDYKNLVLFIRDIEHSKYNLRIENWIINLRKSDTRSRSASQAPVFDETINVIMQIASLQLKT